MSILVTGGTGTVGSQVVRELQARGQDVRVLTRDKQKAQTLHAGVTAVEGDLHDVATVRRIFDGVDAVFLVTVVSLTESADGLMAVAGMRTAGVRRVVYVSVHDVQKGAWHPAARNLSTADRRSRHLPRGRP